MKKENDRGAI